MIRYYGVFQDKTLIAEYIEVIVIQYSQKKKKKTYPDQQVEFHELENHYILKIMITLIYLFIKWNKHKMSDVYPELSLVSDVHVWKQGTTTLGRNGSMSDIDSRKKPN